MEVDAIRYDVLPAESVICKPVSVSIHVLKTFEISRVKCFPPFVYFSGEYDGVRACNDTAPRERFPKSSSSSSSTVQKRFNEMLLARLASPERGLSMELLESQI